jgi:hypothetical protein
MMQMQQFRKKAAGREMTHAFEQLPTAPPTVAEQRLFARRQQDAARKEAEADEYQG